MSTGVESEIQIAFKADIEDAAGKIVRLEKENEKLQQTVAQASEASKKAAQEERQRAREQAEIARTAGRIYDETRTAQERYEAEMGKIATLMKSGAIDLDTHNRKAQQLREELTRPDQVEAERKRAEAAKESAKIRAESGRKAAQEELTLNREAAKIREAALTPLERYNRELANLNTLLEKGKISHEEHGRAAKQAAEGFDKGKFDTHSILTQNVADLKSWALGLVGGGGIIGAIELVWRKMEEWRARMKEIGEEQHKLLLDSDDFIRTTGALTQSKEVLDALDKMPGTQKTKEQMYSGISGALGGEASTERKLELQRAAMEAAELPAEAEKGQFGATVGQFSRLAPTKTPEQITAMVQQAREYAGEQRGHLQSDRFHRQVAELTESGMGAEKALATAVVSAKQLDDRGQAMITAAEAASRKYSDMELRTLAHEARTSPRARAEYELSKMKTAEERLAALRAGPMKPGGIDIGREILGQEQAQQFRLVDPKLIAEEEAKLRQAAEKPAQFLEKETKALRGTASGAAAVANTEEQVRQEELDRKMGPHAARLAAEEREYNRITSGRADFFGEGGRLHLPSYTLARVRAAISGQTPAEIMLEREQGQFRAMGISPEEAKTTTLSFTPKERENLQHVVDQQKDMEDQELQREQIRETKKQTSATEKQTAAIDRQTRSLERILQTPSAGAIQGNRETHREPSAASVA